METGGKEMKISPEEITKRCADLVDTRGSGGGAALVLFGSVARGDADVNSDIDLLFAVDGTRLHAAEPVTHSIASGIGPRCSVVTRSFEQLEWMAARGSVFMLHLQLEAIVLNDPAHRLRKLLASPNIVDFNSEKEGLRQSSAVLYARDLDLRLAVTLRVVKHLLRRATMLECARRGRPVFSTHSVSLELGDQRLPTMLASNSCQYRCAASMRSALADYVGVPSNAGEALSALALRPHTRSLVRDLLSAAATIAYDGFVEQALIAA